MDRRSKDKKIIARQLAANLELHLKCKELFEDNQKMFLDIKWYVAEIKRLKGETE